MPLFSRIRSLHGGEGRRQASPVGGEGTARAPWGGENNISCQKADKTSPCPCLSPNPRHGPRPSPRHIFPSPKFSLPRGDLKLLPVHFLLVGEGKEATAITWAGGVTSQEAGRDGRVGAARTLPPPACQPISLPGPSTPLPPPYFAHFNPCHTTGMLDPPHTG